MTCMYWTACDWAQRGSLPSPWSWTIQSGYNDNSYREPCLGKQIRLCVPVCVFLYMLHSQDQNMNFNGKWGHFGDISRFWRGFRRRLELGWVLVFSIKGLGTVSESPREGELHVRLRVEPQGRQLDRKERGNNRWTERRGQDRWRVRTPNETFHSRTEMFLNVHSGTQRLSNC